MEISILDDGVARSFSDESIRVESNRLSMSERALPEALGWSLKPEGLCKGAICIPVRDPQSLRPPGQTDAVDLEAFATTIGRPCVVDADAGVFALGTPANDQAQAMAALDAPDFELPDVHGEMHTLSKFRGKKVLLIAYASW